MSEKRYDEIVSIEYFGEVETYDLEVEHKDHTFYANNISVSNSHAIAYSFVSYQCAWLFTHYPQEWMCAVLNHVKEKNKQQAISLAKKLGFEIKTPDINISTDQWVISGEYQLTSPLTSIKGLGEKAVDEILSHRPFNTIEELLFHEEISYRKLNKKSLNVLTNSGALDSILDNRFSNRKHAWLSIVEDRPKSPQKLAEKIEEHKRTQPYSKNELIEHSIELIGQYPFHLVISDEQLKALEEIAVPAISEYESGEFVWFVVQEILVKKTTKGKNYWIMKCIDANGGQEDIKVWGVSKNDKVATNKAILAQVQFSPKWRFSIKGLAKSIRYL